MIKLFHFLEGVSFLVFKAHFFCNILPSSGTGLASRGNMKWKHISYSGTGIFLHQIFAVGTQDPVNCQADRGLVTIWQSLATSLLWTSVYSLSRKGEGSPVIRRGDFTNSISQVKSPFSLTSALQCQKPRKWDLLRSPALKTIQAAALEPPEMEVYTIMRISLQREMDVCLVTSHYISLTSIFSPCKTRGSWQSVWNYRTRVGV